MMKSGIIGIVLFYLFLGGCFDGSFDVLVVNVSGPNYNDDGQTVHDTLIQSGANSTFVNLSTNGQVFELLNNDPLYNNIKQIWVFDLSHLADDYPDDWQAIADWFLENPSRSIICDARMISSYWEGRYTSRGLSLSENYYNNLKSRGGGIVLGTDDYRYHSGINTINNFIGINAFSGIRRPQYCDTNTENALMITPNDMGPELWADSSIGDSPIDLQPNGRVLYPVAWYSEDPLITAISSTIGATP